MKKYIFAASNNQCYYIGFTVNFKISVVTLNPIAIKLKESTKFFMSRIAFHEMKIKLFAATKKKCNTFSFTLNFEISAVTLNQMAIKNKESTIIFYD